MHALVAKIGKHIQTYGVFQWVVTPCFSALFARHRYYNTLCRSSHTIWVWVPRHEFWLNLYYRSQWPKTTLNWGAVYVPIHFLVWQQHRTLETLSCDSVQLYFSLQQKWHFMKNSVHVWVPRHEFWLNLYYRSEWPKTTLKDIWYGRWCHMNMVNMYHDISLQCFVGLQWILMPIRLSLPTSGWLQPRLSPSNLVITWHSW